MQHIDSAEFEKNSYMYKEAKSVENNLVEATNFYNETALPILNKMGKSHLIRINDLKSSGSECDVILEIDFFATYDDFEDDFVGADFVQEIVKNI